MIRKLFTFLLRLKGFLLRREIIGKKYSSTNYQIKQQDSDIEKHEGKFWITTSNQQWVTALTLYPKTKQQNLYFFGKIKVLKGSIGINLLNSETNEQVSSEITVDEGTLEDIICMYSEVNDPIYVSIRNTADNTKSKFILENISFEDIGTLNIVTNKKNILLMGLKNPSQAAHACREILYKEKSPEVKEKLPFKLEYNLSSYTIPSAEKAWSHNYEKVIYQTSKDLISLLPKYVTSEMGSNNIKLDQSFFEKYLYMNVVRIVNLYESFNKIYGFHKGNILELGSYFGSFSLALQRLGYEVTAVDRYLNYGKAFEEFTNLMSSEGVNIISTSREDEWEKINPLGTFNAVIAMAVIEHIPHTPRLFLESLKRKVKKNGLLAIDTPNLVRYWARKDFNEGKSTLMPIQEQFVCDIPFEGHHREFTQKEVEWMMKKIGLRNISTVMFDYNQWQFTEIYKNQIDCILKFIENNNYADTILSLGVKE